MKLLWAKSQLEMPQHHSKKFHNVSVSQHEEVKESIT